MRLKCPLCLSSLFSLFSLLRALCFFWNSVPNRASIEFSQTPNEHSTLTQLARVFDAYSIGTSIQRLPKLASTLPSPRSALPLFCPAPRPAPCPASLPCQLFRTYYNNLSIIIRTMGPKLSHIQGAAYSALRYFFFWNIFSAPKL